MSCISADVNPNTGVISGQYQVGRFDADLQVVQFDSYGHVGMGQNETIQGPQVFSPCFRLPWFHFGYLGLTHR